MLFPQKLVPAARCCPALLLPATMPLFACTFHRKLAEMRDVCATIRHPPAPIWALCFMEQTDQRFLEKCSEFPIPMVT